MNHLYYFKLSKVNTSVYFFIEAEKYLYLDNNISTSEQNLSYLSTFTVLSKLKHVVEVGKTNPAIKYQNLFIYIRIV